MTLLDWLVVSLYGVGVVWLGLRVARGIPATTEELLLGGRRLPAWAALFSLVATELSAATFIGVPHAAYTGDWSYLQLAVGALLGKLVVSRWVLPVYRARGVVTVYGFLSERYGPKTRRAAAAAFALGRVLASGARLFIAALAFSVAIGGALPLPVVIVGCGVLAALYTRWGGIRSVVWTDVLQGAVFATAACAALACAWWLTDAAALAEAFTGERTRIVHARPWLSFTDGGALLSAIAAGFFLTCATHSTDHDMVQRLLTTRTLPGAQRALWISALLNFPLTALFLAIGTTLSVYYATNNVAAPEDARQVFALFARDAMPPGLRGLVFAGLFAAAMSSLDSAICAISAAWLCDVRPRGSRADAGPRLRRTSDRVALALVAAAIGMAAINDGLGADAPNLVEFALSAMSILYGGLLGIFALGFASRERGSDTSAVVGLVAGGLAGLFFFLGPLVGFAGEMAWGWRIPIAALASAGLAAVVRRPRKPSQRASPVG